MTEGRITVERPGFYRMTPEQYHGDCAPEPSLSSHIAHTMIAYSPRHAWFDHPRLNPLFVPRTATTEMEEGTILHRLLLGVGKDPVVIPADDWKGEAARRLRDRARSEGRIPVLRWRFNDLKRIAAAARRQLRGLIDQPDDVTKGHPECVLVWREQDAWCRAMVDWLVPRRGGPLIDLKFTGRSAAPEDWRRQAYDLGYDMQAAFYRRGFRAVFRRSPGPFVFVVVETAPPYGVAVNALTPEFEEIGELRVAKAIEMWRQCMASGQWPGYPRRVVHMDAPAYAFLQWGMQAERGDQQLRDRGLPGTHAAAIAGPNEPATSAPTELVDAPHAPSALSKREQTVLGVLRDARATLAVRNIGVKASLSVGAARQVLALLLARGLVTRTTDGRAHFYAAIDPSAGPVDAAGFQPGEH